MSSFPTISSTGPAGVRRGAAFCVSFGVKFISSRIKYLLTRLASELMVVNSHSVHCNLLFLLPFWQFVYLWRLCFVLLCGCLDFSGALAANVPGRPLVSCCAKLHQVTVNITRIFSSV